jgi:hypothetical protein
MLSKKTQQTLPNQPQALVHSIPLKPEQFEIDDTPSQATDPRKTSFFRIKPSTIENLQLDDKGLLYTG